MQGFFRIADIVLMPPAHTGQKPQNPSPVTRYGVTPGGDVTALSPSYYWNAIPAFAEKIKSVATGGLVEESRVVL